MSIRKKLAVSALLVTGLIAAGFVYVKTMRSGGGSYVKSPDGRMTASAMNLSRDHLWGEGSRRWIEYSISYNDGVEHTSESDELFFARYEQPGECRSGDVKWTVSEQLYDAKGRKQLEREAKLLGADVQPEVIHTVVFDCGPTLTLQSTSAVDWYVCRNCLPRQSRDGVVSERTNTNSDVQ